MELSAGRVAAIASAVAALTGYTWLRSKSSDITGDLNQLVFLVKMARTLKSHLDNKFLVPDWWEEIYPRHLDRVCIDFVDPPVKLTYKQVESESNRVANWALAAGLKAKDIVGLMLDNSPMYVPIWLGLAKAGVSVALINSHLKGVPLVKTLQTANAKMFIIGADIMPRVVEAFRESHAPLEAAKVLVTHGSFAGYTALDPLVQDSAIYPVSRRHREGLDPNDSLLLIYTSGTTGLPKAAHFSHLRFMGAAMAFSRAIEAKEGDVLYSALPLYHSAGGCIGVGGTWLFGGTLVTRRKFSAQNFWTDCVNHKVDIVQYIGELARYLVNSPVHPDEARHKVRLAFGNGMRPEVWRQFQARFKVPRVVEFYAATEGNASMINTSNKLGSVGRVSDLMALVWPIRLVRFDVDSEQPIRGPDGLCVVCKPGEVGELVGRIDHTNPTRKFQGYTDKAATEKKILRNVLAKDDEWFRTGDLLVRDKEGFYFFVDRIGDTFRWKGENVSTAEVSTVLSEAPGVLEANVYGVQVFKNEGRAGMACLVVDPSKFDWNALYVHCKKNLPGYAMPLFVRLSQQMDTTGTFKQRKVELVQEGFDPSVVTDPLFFRDDTTGTFVKLDHASYQQLQKAESPKAKL